MEVLELIKLGEEDAGPGIYAVAYRVGCSNDLERNGDAEAGINGVLKSLGGTSRLGTWWVVHSARGEFDLTQRIGAGLTEKSVCCDWVDFMLSGPGMDCVLVVRWRPLMEGAQGANQESTADAS